VTRRALLPALTVPLAAVAIAWVWTGLTPAAPLPSRPAPVLAVQRSTAVHHHHHLDHGLSAPQLGGTLPPCARHGLAVRLRQYPDLSLASPAQLRAAERLLGRLRLGARVWSDPRAAAAAGFDVRRPHRKPGETRVMWFHSENRAWHSDHRYLDPRHPDTLIYADVPGRPLRLVGVMISMPRGLRGPTPGGPITRWHSHLVCVHDGLRGLKPLPGGSCPAGARLVQGSEMMHIWFTHDLRSAFAVHAPGPELCAAGLLTPGLCRDPRALHAM
jgi:hypothetical protein